MPAAPAAKPTAAAAPKPAATKTLTDKQKKDLAKKDYKEAEAKFKDGAFAEALELYKAADEPWRRARRNLGRGISRRYDRGFGRSGVGWLAGAAARSAWTKARATMFPYFGTLASHPGTHSRGLAQGRPRLQSRNNFPNELVELDLARLMQSNARMPPARG